MMDWIMKCVSTASFSINVNGVLHGYFKGKRDLRQGDSMSPYLFTLVMEFLTLMLKRKVTQDGMFQFHPTCERQEIIKVCFADDFFLFADANADSVQVICDALEDFKNCSGLVPSLSKSTIFFSNILSAVKNCILDIMPFEEGVLPVKYLGVPLISFGLFYEDFKILVERVKIKIEDWKNKSLSFAGCGLSQGFAIYVLRFASELRFATAFWSRPNGKMIVDSIENAPFVRRMIATPGEPDLPVLILETFHE
nr:putative reverse transcriptase domain, reverse transcriptase zinc-binding domain protein [Tanacetum cinerariifolium]